MAMKKYIGTKIVAAEPMTEAVFQCDVRHTPIDPQQEDRPGYKVIYEDGYKSWSPKDTFERAYREITTAELGIIGGVYDDAAKDSA